MGGWVGVMGVMDVFRVLLNSRPHQTGGCYDMRGTKRRSEREIGTWDERQGMMYEFEYIGQSNRKCS